MAGMGIFYIVRIGAGSSLETEEWLGSGPAVFAHLPPRK